MNKSNVKFWWSMAWQGVAWLSALTPTRLDDVFVAAMRTDEMFEEVWALLVSRGWVTSVGRVQIARTQLTALTPIDHTTL